jgi:membrane-bound metal-dependent hydrolase YbcI (DUF457 family)
MFFWFLGTSVASVWFVFHDPSMDYRLVMAGSVLPDAIDACFGGARAFHSVAVAVALLVVVMVATVGRRRLRRRLLALPIGVFLHLVFDAAWTINDTFWWPFSGTFGHHRLPSVQRGAVSIVLEVVGIGLLVWWWRRFELTDPERRRQLVRHGVLNAAAR